MKRIFLFIFFLVAFSLLASLILVQPALADLDTHDSTAIILNRPLAVRW